MIKSLANLKRLERETINAPKTIQQTIPIQKVFEDGIFLVGKNKYSLTYKFTDINYSVASKEDKESMFLSYSELLNSFDSEATAKITVAVRRINKKSFESEILLPFKQDGLDIYRKEYNDMLLDKIKDTNGMTRELYLTISIFKNSYEEAKMYFKRIGTELTSHFLKLGSYCTKLNLKERLRLIYDFYHIGEEDYYNFDLKSTMQKGEDFKDYICPSSLSFEKDYFTMDNKYGRVLFLKNYASYIKDNIIVELTEVNKNMMLSIDIIPIPTDEAVKEVEKRLLGVETNITNWQRRQNASNNFSASIPYDLEQQRKESKEFLDDLTTRDQRMMFANLTIAITADTKEELESNTEAILLIARKHLCQIAPLSYQQMDGLSTVLPLGVRKVNILRTLTTESLAALHPFRVQEIMDRHGIYYGENAISHNLIMIDNNNLLNQSSIVLGVPGSGKSFSAKELIVFLALSTDDDILICDPEGEYTALIEALGGEVIKLSASSKDHVNAMDMNNGYGDGPNPIIDKSQFILSLFEQLDSNGLGPKEKSIIDRCVNKVYKKYADKNDMPTLVDLRQELLEQPEKEAKELALELELFTDGSLNIFAHKTNVNTSSRILSYDIYKLGEQLRTMGLLVITDALINRVSENYLKGKRTHIIVDEIQTFFKSEHSKLFFESAWRQYRKRKASPIGITQNAEYMLSTTEGSAMISNSEFIFMLNQSSQDGKELAKLLHISKEQLSYITNSPAGCGLIRYGGSLVPFINKFPTDTRLYKLMTTKPTDR